MGNFSAHFKRREDHRSARLNLTSCEKKAYIFSSQQHKLRLLLQWSFRHPFVNSVVQIYEIYVFIISMQVIKFGEFLNPRMYTQIHTSTVVRGRGFLVHKRLSLSVKMCSQRKAGRRQIARRRFACCLHPSHGPLRFIANRSQLPCEKRSAWGGGWGRGVGVVDGTPPRSFCHVVVFRHDFTFSGKPLIFLTRWGIFYAWWRC